ncbi:hypothetical protein SANTM175S_08626 [Streptomyces antimycoticus]
MTTLTLQLTIDCAEPRRMVAFWSEALGYVPEPAPGGHATWREYWADMGVPAEELPPGSGRPRSPSWIRRGRVRGCGSSRFRSRRSPRTGCIWI